MVNFLNNITFLKLMTTRPMVINMEGVPSQFNKEVMAVRAALEDQIAKLYEMNIETTSSPFQTVSLEIVRLFPKHNSSKIVGYDIQALYGQMIYFTGSGLHCTYRAKHEETFSKSELLQMLDIKNIN